MSAAEAEHRTRLLECAAVLEEGRVLSSAVAVEFLSHNIWGLLDPAWRAALEATPLIDLAGIVGQPPSVSPPPHWPASLSLFVSRCHAACLSRSPSQRLIPSWLDWDLSSVPPLSHRFAVGMSPKKRAEASALGHLVSSLARAHGVDAIVDVGAGQGYLSNLLAFHYGLAVTALDNDTGQTDGARSRDSALAPAVRPVAAATGSLRHVTLHVGGREGELFDVLDRPYGVCGLHTCGDLATSALKAAGAGARVPFVVNVGCCYNLMSRDGFPLSAPATADARARLSRGERMLACQAMERLPSDDAGAIERLASRQYMRAVLQAQLLRDHAEHFQPPWAPIVGRLPESAFESLSAYFAASYAKLRRGRHDQGAEEARGERIELPVPSEEEIKRLESEFEGMRHATGAFWLLRALLAPVAESLILLDRFAYIVDTFTDCNVALFPLFDPQVSPRNMVIVAQRK